MVTAFISRIRQVNGSLNAVVADRFNEALEEAAEIDRVLDDGGDVPERYSVDNAPFLGVPLTAKEAIWIEGRIIICCGSADTGDVSQRKDCFVAAFDQLQSADAFQSAGWDLFL